MFYSPAFRKAELFIFSGLFLVFLSLNNFYVLAASVLQKGSPPSHFLTQLLGLENKIG